MFAACGSNAMYPKTKEFIWVDDHTNLIGHKTAAVKINELVEYCQKAKISKVVFGHLEDVFREDVSGLTFSNYPNAANNNVNHPANGITIRSNMKNTIKLLHQNNITEYAQWLDDRTGAAPNQGVYNLDPTLVTNGGNFNSTYSYDDEVSGGSITHWDEEYDAFIEFNKPANNPNADERFDGIMLDYEYWTPGYGTPAVSNGFAVTGFNNWTTVANTCVTARTNQANTGVKFIQCYLNDIMFTGINQLGTPGIFNWTNGSTTPSTTVNNTIEQIEFIDNLGFDAISLAFWPLDVYTEFVAASQNTDPTSFLTGIKLSNGNESGFQQNRYRIEIFGNESSNFKNTNIIPYFRSLRHANGCNTTAVPENESYLGDLMLYECWWNTNQNEWPTSFNQSFNLIPSTVGEHYMASIEGLFALQFINKEGIVTTSQVNYQGGSNGDQNDPFPDYGNANIDKGFYWFQYGMGPGIDDGLLLTSLHQILLRPNDQINCVLGNTQFKIAHSNQSNTIIYTANNHIKSEKDHQKLSGSLSISPLPIISIAEIRNDKTIINIEVYNMLGINVTGDFIIEISGSSAQLDVSHSDSGIYLLKVHSEDGEYFEKTISIIR